MVIYSELHIPPIKLDGEPKMPPNHQDWPDIDKGRDYMIVHYADCFSGKTMEEMHDGKCVTYRKGCPVQFLVDFPDWTFELVIGSIIVWRGTFDYIDDWWQHKDEFDEEVDDEEDATVHFYKHDVLRNTERVFTYDRKNMTLSYEELPGESIDYMGIQAAKDAKMEETIKWSDHYFKTNFKCKCDHCNNTWRQNKRILRMLARENGGVTVEDGVKLVEEKAAADGKYTSDVFIKMITTIMDMTNREMEAGE